MKVLRKMMTCLKKLPYHLPTFERPIQDRKYFSVIDLFRMCRLYTNHTDAHTDLTLTYFAHLIQELHLRYQSESATAAATAA